MNDWGRIDLPHDWIYINYFLASDEPSVRCHYCGIFEDYVEGSHQLDKVIAQYTHAIEQLKELREKLK